MLSAFKFLSSSALLFCGLVAGPAHAADCSLGISSTSVAVGEPFSFSVSISEVLPGPLPPPTHLFYQVYFYGQNQLLGPNQTTTWIGPEPAPSLLPLGGGTLSGYYNPGRMYGVYTRYAAVYDGPRFVCVTNWVWTILQ